MPTFAAMAGAEIGAQVQGLDLSKHLADPSRPAARRWFYATSMETPWQTAMATDGKWKYIYSEPNGTEELYDQENDPSELHNLAGEPENMDVLRSVRMRLRTLAGELGDTRILAANGFAKTPVDRASFRVLPVKGMGWRWF